MKKDNKDNRIRIISDAIKNKEILSLKDIDKNYNLSRVEREHFATQIALLNEINLIDSQQTPIIWLFGENINFWAEIFIKGLGYQLEEVYKYESPKSLFDLDDIDKKVVWISNLSSSWSEDIPFTTLTDIGFRLPTKGDFYFQSNFKLIIVSSKYNPLDIYSNYPEALRRILNGIVLDLKNQSNNLLKIFNSSASENFQINSLTEIDFSSLKKNLKN